MKKTALSLFIGLIGSTVVAQERVVSDQSFTGELYPSSIQCRDGIPGGFPVNLMMSYNTQYGSSTIINPSTLVLQNVDAVYFSGKPTEKCADYADVLGLKGSVPFSGRKIITEHEGERPDKWGYQRTLREELSLTVGRLTFTGYNSFFVFPTKKPE